jgi:hypothetical protein
MILGKLKQKVSSLFQKEKQSEQVQPSSFSDKEIDKRAKTIISKDKAFIKYYRESYPAVSKGVLGYKKESSVYGIREKKNFCMSLARWKAIENIAREKEFYSRKEMEANGLDFKKYCGELFQSKLAYSEVVKYYRAEEYRSLQRDPDKK